MFDVRCHLRCVVSSKEERWVTRARGFCIIFFSRLRRWRGRRGGHRIAGGDHYELMKTSACVWQWTLTVRSTTKDGRQWWQAIAWRSSHGKCRRLSVNIQIFTWPRTAGSRLSRINSRKQRKVNKSFWEGLSRISRVQVVFNLYESTLSVTTWDCRSSLVPFVLMSALISLATSAGLERRDRQAPILPFWPFPAIYSESRSPSMEEKVCVE